MDAITQSIADAKNASAQISNLPATIQPTQTAVALPQARTTAAGFLQNARVQVEDFLKVKEFGLLIGSSQTLIASFEATIDLAQVSYPLTVRFGNPAEYYKSFNGGSTCANKPQLTWQRILEMAKLFKADASTDPYDTADIVMKTLAEVKGTDGSTVAPANRVLGYSPPYTGVVEWQKCLKAVAEAGGDISTAKIRVKVHFRVGTNKNANKWGIVQFTFLGLDA